MAAVALIFGGCVAGTQTETLAEYRLADEDICARLDGDALHDLLG